MRRPTNATAYQPIDLKLGIKSSLPRVKSTLALLILMWEIKGEPARLIYADEVENALELKPDIESALLAKLNGLGVAYTERQMHDLLARNCMLASQLESLIVAFELVWKVARIRFVADMANSAERTGQKRYAKEIAFSNNMDVLGALVSDNDSFYNTLFNWLGTPSANDQDSEKRLIKVLSTFSEEALYKLTDGTNDVIFNQESLYSTLLSANESVDISGDVEAKGPLRILKSAASEGLFFNLRSNGTSVSVVDRNALDSYYQRVVVKHSLISQVPGVPIEIEQDTPDTDEERLADNESHNILLYGVPGCGKSYTIKTEYCNDDDHMERAVFHPDYTYSDFIGQILPKVSEGRITYEFAPGPFARILKKAVDNPTEEFYLVVEEINRGNAPAIFGDVFQLLDRDESGFSEYGVSNENISAYVYGNTTTKIKIPANLFVLATMNTSDQNVFTLDTAFKRRWTMEMIENNIDACDYAHQPICAWGITWGTFAKTINKKIIELGENNLSNEDNRLGAYFVREADLTDAKRFGEKVLMYLWNDAFKFDHDKVFKAEYRTFDELISAFLNIGFAVFNDEITFEEMAPETTDAIEAETPTAEHYLEGKNPELVEAYRSLLSAVVERIPNAYDSSVGSLTYAAWKTNDIRKASFADVIIQRNKIVIWTEVPTTEEIRVVGEQIPVDNHHNHYFKIIFDSDHMEQIVVAIEESYNQLKVE